MPIRRNNTSSEYKALLASFDAVFSASIAEKCVNLSDQEILAILSQSDYLKWRTRWYKGEYSQDFDESEIDAIKALAASIQDKLINGLDDCIDCEPGDCIEYAPNASIIEWSPSTPGNVNDIPAGYRENPWYIINESFVGGYVRGDVLCDANSTLPQSAWDYLSIIFTSGTPRFRVHVNGRGQVELHLLRLAFGGIALVWQDDDYTTADVVDLQSYALADIAPGTVDLLTFIDNAIDGDFSDVLIHERYFDTDGPHHIDVSFLPILDANISQLGWGGGLRKIVLCGFDDMTPIPQFRIVDNANGCRDFQYKYDDQDELAWVTLTTICDGEDGQPGAPGSDGQNCDCVAVINNITIMPDTNHIVPDGLNKRCNIASYLVDVPLPSLMQELLAAHADANGDDTALILGVIGISAVILTGGAALGFIPAIYAGYGIGSLALGGAIVGLLGIMEQIDINQAAAEMTPQFWQNVKCVIYCALGNDGILNDETMIRISDEIESDIIPNYPNAGELLKGVFLTTSPEARGQWQIYGALYEGANCDLCACGGWTFVPSNQTYVSKYELVNDNTIKTGSVYRDGTFPPNNDELIVTYDLSKTPAYFIKVRVTGKVYKESGDSGGRFSRLEIWDENAQNWVVQWEAGYSTGVGEDKWSATKPGGADTVLLFPTTKIRITQTGWGTGSSSWEFTKLQVSLIGAGPNVFLLEQQGLI